MQKIFHSKSHQKVREGLKPYQFLLDILIQAPKQKNIIADIENACLRKGIRVYS